MAKLKDMAAFITVNGQRIEIPWDTEIDTPKDPYALAAGCDHEWTDYKAGPNGCVKCGIAKPDPATTASVVNCESRGERHRWVEQESRPAEVCTICLAERPYQPEGPKVPAVERDKIASDFMQTIKEHWPDWHEWARPGFIGWVAQRAVRDLAERLTVQVPAPPSSMGAPLTKSALECFIPDPSKPAEPRTEGAAISLKQLDWLLDRSPDYDPEQWATALKSCPAKTKEAIKELAKKVDQERTKEKSTDHLRGKDILRALW